MGASRGVQVRAFMEGRVAPSIKGTVSLVGTVVAPMVGTVVASMVGTVVASMVG